MSFLIDTDIGSAHLKGRQAVFNRFVQYGGGLFVSVVTVAKLVVWASRARAPAKRQADLDDLLQLVTPLEVTMDVARKFGQLQAALLDAGTPAPALDLLIAATALIHGLTLVTHNSQDYTNIPGLTLDDWLIP